MTAPLFQFAGLRVSIGARSLLAIDVFELFAGRCILLRGDNGAGKSTLLKTLAGLHRADTMQLFAGKSVLSAAAAQKWLQKAVVYLHQQPYLFDCSVEKNIAYGLRRRGIAGAALRARVEAGLEWAGLTHLRNRNGREVSGGERQRLALVRAYVLEAQVILLDEPTAGMDEAARRQTLGLIGALRDGDTSVVVTSHEYFPDTRFADEVLLLRDGALHVVDHFQEAESGA